MKTIQITMPITYYVNGVEIANLKALGAPAIMLAKLEQGQFRTTMVRSQLCTSTFIECEHIVGEDEETMFVKGGLTKAIANRLQALVDGGVITNFCEFNLRQPK